MNDVPFYSIGDVAHNLWLSSATVRTWLRGRTYRTRDGERYFEPLIKIADPERGLLSFRNLVEVFVLSSLRREHKVRIFEVRRAIDYLENRLETPHPLADQQMSTDGKDLFIEKYGQLINASQEGQTAMKEVMAAYLQRVKRDHSGAILRMFPVIGNDDSHVIAIDPRIHFGRPCITGTGIPTAIIADRVKAGDAPRIVAKDYNRPVSEILKAVEFEKAS